MHTRYESKPSFDMNWPKELQYYTKYSFQATLSDTYRCVKAFYKIDFRFRCIFLLMSAKNRNCNISRTVCRKKVVDLSLER